MNLEISEKEAELIFLALDGHVKTHGLRVSGQCLAVAVKVEAARAKSAKTEPPSPPGELADDDKGKDKAAA